MGGDISALDSSRARIEAGVLVGPRVARAGYVLESRDSLEGMLALYDEGNAYADDLRRTRIGIATEADAREAVARIVDSCAEILKIRSSPSPDLYRLLVREARSAGLRVTGHEPCSVDIIEAASLGVGSLEHFPLRMVLMQTTEERLLEIHASMIEHALHVTPTIHAMRTAGLTADELSAALGVERNGPRWASLSPELIAKWKDSVSLRSARNGALDWNALCDQGEGVMRAMHGSGMPLLAGADLGLALLFPGHSLHDELRAHVERLGLDPLESLRTATVNAAAWLGWDDLGAIRAGNLADLVLLEADPLEGISNVGRIHSVISRGVVYGPEERERMLASIGAKER